LIGRGLDENHLSSQKLRDKTQWLRTGARGDKPLPQSDAPGLYLLFEEGKRPSAAAIHAFAAAWEKVSVSHNPAGMESLPVGNPANVTLPNGVAGTGVLPLAKQWMEVLRDGLTFDLAGLAPGPACTPAETTHFFDWSGGNAADHHEAMLLSPGPHVHSGAGALPVLRSMVALARDFALFFEELAAVVWPHSASLIGRRFFESTATAWLDGGPFPALGLTAFDLTVDGALETTGLGLWIGQEMRIDPALAQDKVAATRLGVRLVNHLVMLGGLRGEERIVAPDGMRLVMVPTPDGSLVRVQRE
jgi:hypothetical protein